MRTLCAILLVSACGGPLLAQPADEALREHTIKRSSNQVRIDTNINESGNRAGRVIGMQGRKDEVAGKSRLDRNSSRLLVTNLAYYYNVWVLS